MYLSGIKLIAQKEGNSNLNYYLHNAHGDITNMVSGNGEVLNSYTYDAFGNIMNQTETVDNRFKYTGEQFDNIAGQYYLRARFYNPTIGRFISEDTYRGSILDPMSLNLYTCCANNPILYVDPSGHIYLIDDNMAYNHHTGNTIMYNPVVEDISSVDKCSMSSYSQGSVGTEVIQIQRTLRDLGYDISVDGDYGPQTANVVTQFQLQMGLEVDGIVGRNTWGALVGAASTQSKDYMFEGMGETGAKVPYTIDTDGGYKDGKLYGINAGIEGNNGLVYGEADASLGMVKMEGKVVTGVEDNWNGTKVKGGTIGVVPGVDIRGGVKVSGVNVEAGGGIGDNNLGASVQGEGDALTANAYGAFMIRPEQGTVGLRAGAEAAVLNGEGSIKFNVLGWSVQIGGEVSALSVGAKAELSVENMQLKARAKAALGLGAGVNIQIGPAR